MFKPKPKTLPQLLIRAVAQSDVSVALFAASYFVASMGPVNMTMPEQETPSATAEPTRAQVLMEKWDCWAGEAPADMQGKMPGHVVVTEGGRTFVGGSVKVGTALSHIFEGTPTEIEVIHGFCR